VSTDRAAASTTHSDDFVQSLERGLAVIKAFDAEDRELTLSDVARKTGLTRAAARRVCLSRASASGRGDRSDAFEAGDISGSRAHTVPLVCLSCCRLVDQPAACSSRSKADG